MHVGTCVPRLCSGRNACRRDDRGALRVAACGRFPDSVAPARQAVRRVSAAAGRIRACSWEGRRSPKPLHEVRILALVPCQRPGGIEILEISTRRPKIMACRPFPQVRGCRRANTMSRRESFAGPENGLCYAKRAALMRGSTTVMHHVNLTGGASIPLPAVFESDSQAQVHLLWRTVRCAIAFSMRGLGRSS